MNRPCPQPRPRRRGFTLVELLIVIVIIGILVALLIPVLAAAMRNARNAQASGEINNLVGALTQFNNQYGDYPPSRIILSETGSYPVGSTACPVLLQRLVRRRPAGLRPPPTIILGTLAQQSVRYLQKFFPKAQLVRSVAVGTYFAPWDQNKDGTEDYWPDFNGNGVQDPGYLYLEGHECLAFFLGGIPQPTGPANTNGGAIFQVGDGLVGFGKDPRYPFKYSTIIGAGGVNMMATGNRTPVMYEFQANRLVDDDGDGIPGYVDPFHSVSEFRYYAYFSAYGTNSYNPNDINFGPGDANYPEVDSNGQALAMPFRVNFPLPIQPTVSPSPNPYTSNLPVPSQRLAVGPVHQPQVLPDHLTPAPTAPTASAASTTPPAPPPASALPLRLSFSGDVRNYERDNVTNFSQGAMD